MIDSLPSGLAGHSYSMSPSGSSSVTDSDMLVQEPESYDSPDDNQESEPDVSRERASFSESDRSTPYMSEAGDVQTRASIISQSSFDAYPSTLIPFETFDTHIPRGVEDDHSSPEPSFPPTPQFTADTPAFLNLGYSSVFSQQSRTSIYEDLSATLEYDYSQAVSQFSSSASEQDAVSSSPSLGESAPCDFQPGSSVQTIRAYNLHDPPSHFRSSSCQDGTAQELSHMDTLPLSPTTIGANIDAPSRTSSGSSAYEDDADFLTVYSDSSDEEYLTAPLSRSPSPTAGLPPLEGSAAQCLQLPYAEEHELSESSGIDITERLSRLSIFSQSDTASSRYVSAPEYVDAAEEGSRGSRTQSHHGESSRHSESSDRHQGTSSSYGGGRAGGMGFGGGSGGGRRDRDGDDDRYRRPYPRSAAPDYATPETSEEEDSSDEDESGRPKLSRRQGRRASSSEGDDVPLAQQIPSALRAQRSIRMQVRDEAVQKRRAKSLRRPGSSGHSAPDPQPALPTQRVTPDHSAGVHVSRAPSTSRALPVLQEPPKPTGRPRTKTLPSQAGGSPFAVGDLTKKLLNVHTAPPLPHSPISPARSSHDQQGPQSPKQSTSRLPSQPDQYANLNPAAQDVSIALRLRNMRSFHRPRTTGGESEPPPPTPSAGAQLGRSNTGATRRPQPPDSQPAKSLPQNAAPSLERARSTRSQSRRPSVDRSARPSVDQDARTPMPPMPTVVKTPAWQQRVFVGTLQRFSQVEITATSTARDVLEILQSQAALEDSVANGWMMWEVCQDFGMGTLQMFTVTIVCSSSVS
ncbi:uncharacterized protein PHACADRAFT_261908 [Phanerochaete carnosa HHB-10118-sp]|uniref:Uncharacterized protein n=1 Tax=Phanerochaete carnosa (strain HHB-10118-sp) TaxID=650164 RepID=K5UPE7_PHACS|nr:uncharacterized protein PHACADRAFT_261908 [Phanerochaete carnosa HHB-10118-sp]EKM51651.1 hypothetical protein PHACADRAFT_261908 [Phanerochaete carnosa HHB-10118-sp]